MASGEITNINSNSGSLGMAVIDKLNQTNDDANMPNFGVLQTEESQEMSPNARRRLANVSEPNMVFKKKKKV